MEKKIYYVDIDNTIYDAESRLHNLYPEFDPLKQTSYKYSDRRYLDAYKNKNFYKKHFINHKVVQFVVEKHNEGHQIVFMSMSLNNSARLAKIWLLKDIFGDKLGTPRLLNIFPAPKDQTQADSEMGLFKDLMEKEKCGIVFVDDAPYRLGILESLGADVVVVEHPYNKNFANKGYETLLPAYYKGWNGYEQ